MNKIYTKFDETAAPLIKKMAVERGMIAPSHNDYEFWYLGCGPCQSFDWNLPIGGHKAYKEVQLHEFISALAEIPVKQKEIIISILPWKVVIKGDKVDIGCRKDVSKADFKQLISGIDSLEGEKLMDIQNKEFTFSASRLGFYADCAFISWETWDKFKEELKKNQIIP